ncbi:hypothetical protein PR048_032402 [Dryococelus australis]|uniref:HAT C-terminal dimerisation domain-containing protein n=1 Tax=Dryococelus australis TaxID=614101 RepID=A0ABQ9G230_9NEOP|nr:hypothetical protein PR048_032402 [Dryococelus australis]
MMVGGASEAINAVFKCLREKRNEDGLNHLWSEMDSKVKEYELIFPTSRRSENTPKRLQRSNYAVPDYQFASPEELYRKAYFEALDKARATQSVEWNSKVTETLQEKYFHLQQLGHQIEMLKKLSPEQEKFLCYLLVTPVTSAIGERSFYMLRMLKSYLRTAMTQKILNSLCILHVYVKCI